MGVNKSQFDALKFRTMYVNGDEIIDKYPGLKAELARNHKLKDDPRVTRVGRFLRKWSLDELPQLINVIKRDMSVVGPRMIAPEEMGNYSQWNLNLLTVKPGITGLWQVSGRSDDIRRARAPDILYPKLEHMAGCPDFDPLIPAVLRRVAHRARRAY
jgi:lipopolysaccharide/colanic/teichoic acid biosynthesis glycosyltransferase